MAGFPGESQSFTVHPLASADFTLSEIWRPVDRHRKSL